MIKIFDLNELKHYKNIHMVGIGGISMSGIAEILFNWGFHVTGYDACDSEIVRKLNETGIPVVTEHNLDFINQADLVVYTAAIKKDNPELVEARNLGVPTIERKDFLGIITKSYLNTIGISGTHGKTTTTSMVSLCFLEENLDPTIQVGAMLKQINGNYRIGNSNYFIIEACEYAESFLKFHLKSAVILNIDNDHLDYFKTFENIKLAFVKYVKKLPKSGFLVLNADDPNCLDLRKETRATVVTYGLKNLEADFIAKDIQFDENGCARFQVYYHSEFYETFSLSVPGIHNVSNALAAISLCHSYGISKDAMKSALAKFTGANRRCELLGKFSNGIKVFDDYGHHPTEIHATACAISQKKFHSSWVVFQPHTYSRTQNLLEDFAKALLDFDHIIITDIYAARETNTYGITSEHLVDEIKNLGKNAIYIQNFDEIVKYLEQHMEPDDLVLTLGAGTVVEVGKKLVKNNINKGN